MELEAHRVMNTIQAMNKQGFKNIGLFLTALLSSEDTRVSNIADTFIREWCISIISHILRRSKWGPKRRQTTKGTQILSKELGEQLVDVVLPILSAELTDVTAIPFARISPTKLRSSHLKGFSFRQFERMYKKHAPLLSRLIRSLCNVEPGEHAGNRAVLRSHQATVTEECERPISEVIIEQGWNEDDDWYDEERWHSSNSESTNLDSNYRDQRKSGKSRPTSPQAPRPAATILERDQRVRNISQTTIQENLSADRGGYSSYSLPEPTFSTEVTRKPMHRSRRTRNRAMIATTIVAQIGYARSQLAGTFQSIMSAYNYAACTSKRACAVLNQLGVTMSPLTFERALKHHAQKACQEVRLQVAQGRKIAFFYDNLVIYDRKGEESLINKNRSLQLTTCAGYFLKMPDKPAEEINSIADPDLALRPTPSKERRGIIPMRQSGFLSEVQTQDESLMNTAPLLPTTLCSESRIEPEEGYVDFTDSSRGNSPSAIESPGIETRKLFRFDPNFLEIRPLDVISANSAENEEFYSSTVKAHLCLVLARHCSSALKKNQNQEIKPYKLKTLYQVPIESADIFTLPTLDLDESTIDGNAAILEELVHEVGLNLKDIQGITIPISGDQMTLSRIRSVQELRIRDEPEHRAQFASPWMGFLHYGFAAIDVVKRCNIGQQGGGDPGSIETIVQLLGRTGIVDGKPNFNATHRLIEEMCDAYILAAFMEIAQVQSMADLNKKLTTEDWTKLVDAVYNEYYPLNKVDVLRTRATEIATALYESHIQPIQSLRVSQRTAQQRDLLKASGRHEFITKHTDLERDLPYENALLFMQQSLLYRDYFMAMRRGDAGRLEKSIEFFLILFEGAGKSNYARELMEHQVDRKVLWTPYMRAIWRNNCLLNISGRPNKFLAVDEVCEYLVRQLKSSYNPRNNWQSKDFHMKTLSRLTMFLRDIRTTILSSSGAPSYGTNHSHVSSEKDIKTIIQHIVENQIVYYEPGRTQISRLHNARRVKESSDAWSLGKVQHWTGIPLASVVRKRVGAQLASKVYNPAVPPGHHPIDHEDAFDAGSLSGGDSDEQFDGGDESVSDGNCESISDTSNDTEREGHSG